MTMMIKLEPEVGPRRFLALWTPLDISNHIPLTSEGLRATHGVVLEDLGNGRFDIPEMSFSNFEKLSPFHKFMFLSMITDVKYSLALAWPNEKKNCSKILITARARRPSNTRTWRWGARPTFWSWRQWGGVKMIFFSSYQLIIPYCTWTRRIGLKF